MNGDSRGVSAYNRAFVLDTAALLLGFTAEEDTYTTEENIKEVKHDELKVARLQAMLDSGAIKTIKPTLASLNTVQQKSRTLKINLSRADTTLLAAALDLRVKYESLTVVTDDYAVQRLAAELGLNYIPLKLPGIRKNRHRPIK
mgnify:CR=1 FL=1